MTDPARAPAILRKHTGALIDAGSYEAITVRPGEVEAWYRAADVEARIEAIAAFVEHLRDEYQSQMEPVGKVARLIRERFALRKELE